MSGAARTAAVRLARANDLAFGSGLLVVGQPVVPQTTRVPPLSSCKVTTARVEPGATAWSSHQSAAGTLVICTLNHVSVAAVATRVGYQSDVAFAAAFKREVGSSPSTYRRTTTS